MLLNLRFLKSVFMVIIQSRSCMHGLEEGVSRIRPGKNTFYLHSKVTEKAFDRPFPVKHNNFSDPIPSLYHCYLLWKFDERRFENGKYLISSWVIACKILMRHLLICFLNSKKNTNSKNIFLKIICKYLQNAFDC